MATAGFIQPIARERALLWCMLASIALHALVLLGISLDDAAVPPSRTLLALTATLAPFAAAPQAPVHTPPPAHLPPQASEPVSAPRPALTKPVVLPAPVQQTTSAEPAKPEPTFETPPAPPGSASSTAPSAAPVQPRPVAQTVARAPGNAVAATSGMEADAGTLEQYRLALIVAMRRYKHYPAIAMEKGWQGRVEVRLVIGADGMLVNASIKAGSGHEILDQQALDMLDKGKSAVPVPVRLRGREFSIDVPVIFNLDNPNS